jgi:BCD family chlorophyll transporter-like MFS transporter
MAVVLAQPLGLPMLFGIGAWMIGFGGGLFGHGTLTATMNAAPKDQAGLALGAWGAVQATSAGVAIAAGGVLRDALAGMASRHWLGTAMATSAAPYNAVYVLEIVLLMATMWALAPMIVLRGRTVPA